MYKKIIFNYLNLISTLTNKYYGHIINSTGREMLSNLINDVRRRYNYLSLNNGIAFIDAYIADSTEFWPYYQIINNEKYNVS